MPHGGLDADRGSAHVRIEPQYQPGAAGRAARPPRLDRGQGAAAVGAFVSAAPPAVRYARAQPGELLHLDTKKLGRFWHVGKRVTARRHPAQPAAPVGSMCTCPSMTTRGWPMPRCGPRIGAAMPSPSSSGRWCGSAPTGISVQAVMTDNGSAYLSAAWRQHCAARGLRHLRTRPYTPRTNGKAERFIQILLRTWA